MLDYLETGLFGGRPETAAPGPRRRPRPVGPDATSGSRRRDRSGGRPDAAPGSRRRPPSPDGPVAGLRRLLGDGRVLAVAAVVAVALAILAGTSVPLHSTQAGPGRPSATPSLVPKSPGTSAPPSPTPSSTTQPSTTPPSARPSASAGVSDGAVPRQARPAATAGATAATSPMATASATRRAAQAATGTAVVVTFTVTTQSPGVFEGKVRIVNNGTSSLASWQVSVALPGDRVVAIANASGVVINGILLLEPASGAGPIPARGGALNIFFVLAGPQPVSGACTYNQTPCA